MRRLLRCDVRSVEYTAVHHVTGKSTHVRIVGDRRWLDGHEVDAAAWDTWRRGAP